MRISVILTPSRNGNVDVAKFGRRLAEVFSKNSCELELIYIGCHSDSKIMGARKDLNFEYPIRVARIGNGKGCTSLIQSIRNARYNIVATLSTDFLNSPELIIKMATKLTDYDLVVAKQPSLKVLTKRRYFSKLNQHILGVSNSELPKIKVFKKKIAYSFLAKRSIKTFDYHFLYGARRMGWKILKFDISKVKRIYEGEYTRSWLSDLALTLKLCLVRARYLLRDIFKFLDEPHHSERHPVSYTNRSDYLYLPEIFSARKQLYPETISLFFSIFLLFTGLFLGFHELLDVSFLVMMSGVISLFYLSLMLFKLFVVSKSLSRPFVSISQEELEKIDERELPIYTILIPLYQEAEVAEQIIEAMVAIDYPKDKLDIIVTLEEYDHATLKALIEAGLPEHFKTLILPNVKPKTKPKALNVAFPKTKGEFVVIYDAEIVPDPNQLKKAYLAFKKHPEIACFQTRLDHYNANQSIITRLFNSEFSFYYDLFLPGLQKLGYPIPLSGHSTHFRRQALENIGAWDPYNVTEDCDLGIRLYRMGFKSDILNSTSKEEATNSISSWLGQRTRWMKGFVQTSIVHLRHPLRFKNEVGGWPNFLAFLFTVPGTVVINFLNFFYWLLLAGWLGTKSVLIQALFPGFVFYLSVISFVVGNTLFTYLNLIGAYKRQRYSIVKYCILSPIYWILLSLATIKAVYEVIVKPYHWDKTKHGEHIARKDYVPKVLPKADAAKEPSISKRSINRRA